MDAVVSLLNTLFTAVFGAVHGALRWLGPFWSLVGVSGLAGIGMVWLFGKVSNQDAIQTARDRLSAELIGLRLFKDDLRVFFAIQGQVGVWTLKYLRHSLVPMLILMVPTLIVLIQLNLHYGARPLRVGEATLVKVKLRDARTLPSGAAFVLSAPDNVRVETPAVRIPELKEVCWRVRGQRPGRFDLTITQGQDVLSKRAAVGGPLEGVSSTRSGAHWLTRLIYPGEPRIPTQSAIELIEIRYPELELSFLGFHVNWLILFLAVSLIFGFAFKGVLGVQI